MVELARQTGIGVCAMHMQGTPQTMQDNPTYADIVAEIRDYLRKRRDALTSRRAPAPSVERIIDVGFELL